MFDATALRGVVIVCGHYGVGKTNLALNLAVDAARSGVPTTLVDLDIVNPYFRSSDYRSVLDEAGVELIAPLFAGTSLDSPGLSGRVVSAVEAVREDAGRLLIIDAGGDEVGATALGRFARYIAVGPYVMVYVVNAYRNLTRTPEEAAALLPEIEAASHLTVTHLMNNSHLKAETTAATIESAIPFGLRAAELAGVPLLAQTVPNTQGLWPCSRFSPDESGVDFYPIEVYVTTPWE